MNQTAYNIANNLSRTIAVAAITVGTQFAVAIWIWSPTSTDKKVIPSIQARDRSIAHHWSTWLIAFLNFAVLMILQGSYDVEVETLAANLTTTASLTIPLSAAYYQPIAVAAGLGFFLLSFWLHERLVTYDKDHGVTPNNVKDLESSSPVAKTLEKTGDSTNDSQKTSNQVVGEIEKCEPTRAMSGKGKEDSSSSPSPSSPSPVPKSGGKVYYINNVKIFLTFMVIAHHCAGQFVNMSRIPQSVGASASFLVLAIFSLVNQSYFMALFFFFSGYFTPRSLDRKGRWVFLLERYRRLGIPSVLMIYLLENYLGWCLQYLTVPLSTGPSPTGQAGTDNEIGVMWFCVHLLLMNTLYAFVCGKGWSPRVAYPGIAVFLVIGLFLGAIGGCLTVGLSDGYFAAVPCFWPQYLLYIVFFFAGALAQKNAWMKELRFERAGILSRVLIYTLCLGLLVFVYFYAAVIMPSPSLQTWWMTIIVYAILRSGMATVVWSLGVTFFFMDFVNGNYGSITTILSQSMYTAYIIQLIGPIQVAMYIFSLIYDATHEVPLYPQMNVVDGQYLILYALFVTAIAQTLAWSAGYGIRSIPGFSKVL